jgi:hypothetical protein
LFKAYWPIPVHSELVKIRSVLSPVKATLRPLPSWPTKFSAGTSTLSKNTWWLLSGWFMTVRIGVHDSPGASVGTMNTDRRPRPLTSSTLVRATNMSHSADSIPVMNTFCPLIT